MDGATTPELVADERCLVGEGPLWHDGEQRLYWVDIPAGRIFRYDPAAGAYERVYQGDVVGGFTFQADGALLLFGEGGSIRRWRDGELSTLIGEIPEERGSRFNDVIADPDGRVFCGTMPDGDRPGRLYRLDPDGSLTVVLADAGLSNGMGFTPDLRAFYHTDSDKRTITRSRYDRTSGAIGDGRVIVRTPDDEGLPDGMAVDAAGDLWSARWDGGALYRYAPDGTLRGSIPFPAKKVSSVTFGGPNHADAYVTTAGGDDPDGAGPGAGALFRLRLGIAGRPAFRSRIGLG